jgi:acyl carrier protein
MNEADIRVILKEELGNIAPEMDLHQLDSTSDLRDALDIDSMDFLNFVIALFVASSIPAWVGQA